MLRIKEVGQLGADADHKNDAIEKFSSLRTIFIFFPSPPLPSPLFDHSVVLLPIPLLLLGFQYFDRPVNVLKVKYLSNIRNME